MEIINISFGQCGNQIDGKFYSCLPVDNIELVFQRKVSKDQKRDKKYYPRSILVDMEPKVVDQCLNRQNQNFQFDKTFSFVNQMGSGNNWAFGFNSHGPNSKQQILDLFQKQLEQTDYLDGILIMQSLAGGTGSGLGSYMTKQIKINYPKIKILNISILPNISGEVIIQNYNCLLSLACLQQYSDGIILMENDEIQNACQELQKIKNPKIDDLNKVIASQLGSIFSPVLEKNENQNRKIYSPFQNQFNQISDIYSSLLTDPDYKLLKLFTVPTASEQCKEFNNDSWSSLEKRITQMIISNSSEANINWRINFGSKLQTQYKGIIIIARGLEIKNFTLQNHLTFSNVYYDSKKYNKNEKSISAITNGATINEKLEKILNNANQMFKEKAFFYQYQNHGITELDFVNSMIICEQILKNYQKLS